MPYICIFWNWRIFYEVICIFMLKHLTRIFNLSTISSFETRTLNYSTRVYWHQIGCEIASYGWECRICRGEHGRTGCIKISSLRPRTASNSSVKLTIWIRSLFRHPCFDGVKISRTFYLRTISFATFSISLLWRTDCILSHCYVFIQLEIPSLCACRTRICSHKTQLLYHFFHIALINQ